MNRRILFTILGAIAFALIVGLLWWWFFSGAAGTPSPTGTFGTGDNRPSSTGGTGTQGGNTSSNVLPNQGSGSNTGTNIPIGTNTQGGSSGIQQVGQVPGVESVPGVDYLGGTSGGLVSGPTTSFIPKTINQLNDGTVGGSPGIVGSFGGGSSGSGSNGSNVGALGGLVAGAGCALLQVFQGTGAADATAKGATALGGGFVLTYDFNTYSKLAAESGTVSGTGQKFWDCLARTVGKAVIAQMTNSIINWINSGFNGKPSFVTNYEQFFTNVSDQAAGEFIRGTSLSFLCSPFQNQIRIAIAQSYARRNNAASCTLTGIIRNVNAFMNGNFYQGGWPGLLQFTTVPTNNPYGAYAYAQMGLLTAQNNALANANRNITPGGFISLQKCDPPGSKNCRVVTPGSVIEQSLKDTLQQPFLANQLAKSFDEITSALLNQLVTRTLYSGLSSLSGSSGYAANYLTPQQQQAQSQAQALLNDIQTRVQIVQQYGSVSQGSIRDIQDAQQKLNDLANCYSSKGQSAQASSTLDVLHSYDTQIDLYNSDITFANQAIAILEDLQTRTISVTSPADVTVVLNAYNQALASGNIPSQNEVIQAQQDRVTLQSQLTTRNAQTATALQQCYAQ